MRYRDDGELKIENRELDSEWKEYRLSEIMNIIGGGTPKTSIPDYWNGDVPWLSVKDFNSDSRKVYETEKRITLLGLENSSTKLLDKGDLIISARGTVGALAQLGKPMAFNQSCYGLRANEVTTNDYLYYLIKYKIRSIQQNTHGSVFDTITRDTFEILTAKLPDDIWEQKAITHILSTLDEKIEVNNLINKTLEEMAQAIFKHWFVYFEFPNEDGEPYKSSGGEMVESELGMIPKGWEVKQLLDISTDIVTGKTPSTKDKTNFGGNIPFVKIPDMHGNVYITKTESYLSESGIVANKIIPKNSVIVSCIATPGLVSLASEVCQTNQQINTIVCKEKEMCYFTFFLLRNLSDYIKTLGSTGSATLNLNKGEFSKIKVIVPNLQLINAYYQLVNSGFYTILNNQKLNMKLGDIRDTLLPKLMSGEIRVSIDKDGEIS